ncbi:hypothetical protein EBU71_02355 [bacterium]|nr:hypothetical protein [Candidatus Elulimicrobium humile]
MSNYSWHSLPRIEKTTSRLKNETIFDKIVTENIDYGIILYRNAISDNICNEIINKLEDTISSNIVGISWSGAQVNDKEEVDSVRNCLDLKYKREHLGNFLPYNQNLYDIHKYVEESLDKCLSHYEGLWHLKMSYKEAFNFVKYLPGKYFKIHADHGPYYSCTVSAVAYLNDDYEGGEIEFVRHGIKIKPGKGDIILFPSNYVYEHASCEIFSGTKYSVVIMLDYNDLHHRE